MQHTKHAVKMFSEFSAQHSDLSRMIKIGTFNLTNCKFMAKLIFIDVN